MSMRALWGTRALVVAAVIAFAGNAHADYRPDAWITLKAKLALVLADDVQGTDINVDTVNQRVSLHGFVDTEGAKSAAERIVRDIEGVTDVRNWLEVEPEEQRERQEEQAEANDERIEQRLEEMLERAETDAIDVEVESVNDGVVVLEGEVDSLARQVSLIEAVKRVPGVRHVESRIEAPEEFQEPEHWRVRQYRSLSGDEREQAAVDEPAERDENDPFEDMWITTAVKAKLLTNGDVPALDINVDTWNGEVTLFGIVGTEAAKREAEAEARSVDSVKDVRNELQVVPESAKEATEEQDEAVEERVEETLDAREDLHDIQVEVVDGVARLTGEVDSVTAQLAAATLVRSVQGVKSVVNDLRVVRRTS